MRRARYWGLNADTACVPSAVRRLGTILLALLLWQGVAGQPDRGQAAHDWKLRFEQRVPARRPVEAGLRKAAAAADRSAAVKGRTLPTGTRWVPGEWEEVQAVVLTPVYRYKPLGVAAPDYWEADPLVPGWADWYEYARVSAGSRQYSWQYRGTGPYYAVLDTVEARSQVPFYLMDAVQQGGAEAWVHVEQYADSVAVLRHLSSSGLRHDRVRFFEAPANSFWYRDCGPICFYYGEEDSIGMLDFQYYTGRAFDDSLPAYLSRRFGLPCFGTSVEWEGGNCLADGVGMVVSSDRIYAANADDTGQYVWDGRDIGSLAVAAKAPLTQGQVRDSLWHLLALRQLEVLPSLQFDGGTGHIDLYADMVDENTFVFSRMPARYSRWADYGIGNRNADTLAACRTWAGRPFRTATIPFPSRDNGAYFASQNQYESFTRTYSNHLFVNQLLVQPCFSPVGTDGWPTAAWDRANVERIAETYPGYRLYCIDVREYDGTGGSLHCLTKQIPAASPIRILHTPVEGQLATAPAGDSVGIEAYITNNRGISRAVVHYRENGGAWRQAELADSGSHRFVGAIQLQAYAGGGAAVVDYYLAATNADGKTITKPMTALQGGCYSFAVGRTGGLSAVADTLSGYGSFYPNPAVGQVRIDVAAAEGGVCTAELRDAAGRTVCTGLFTLATGGNTLTLPLRGLPAGVYTAVFTSGETTVLRKLIVR